MAKLQEAQPESGSKSGNTDLSWGSFYCDKFKACRNRTQRQAYHGATKDPWCAFPRYSRLCLPAKQTKAEIEKAKSNCTNYNIVHDCINCITLSPCTKTTSSNLPAFRSLRVALLSPHLDVVTGSAPCDLCHGFSPSLRLNFHWHWGWRLRLCLHLPSAQSEVSSVTHLWFRAQTGKKTSIKTGLKWIDVNSMNTSIST